MLAELITDIALHTCLGTGLWVLLLILGVTLTVLVVAKRNVKFRDIPGPRGHPFWGNTFELGAYGTDTFAKLISWTKDYGDVYKLYMKPGGYFIYTSKPEHVKHILFKNSSNYGKSTSLASLLNMSAGSIIFADGKDYHKQRKMIKPVFTMHGVKVFIPIYKEKADDFIQIINQGMVFDDEQKEHTEIKLLEHISKLCLDIIGECAIGYKFNSLHGQNIPEISALLNFTSLEFNIARSAIEDTFPISRMFWSGERKRLLDARKVIRKMIHEAILQRNKEMQDDDDVFERGDLLDALLKLYKTDNADGKQFDMEICSQIFTFLLAGFEPVGLTIFWTLYLLAKHPCIQENVRKEIRQLSNSSEDLFSLQSLEQMDLLNRCIKESQRLYPSVILVRRTAKKDDYLAGIQIPAGTDVAIGICSIHRDSKHWENPLEFNPDRFLITDEKDTSTFCKFLPYGRGGRMCLATWFAEIEMKIVLAKLINSFHFSLASNQPDDLPCQVNVTLKPKISPVFHVRKIV